MRSSTERSPTTTPHTRRDTTRGGSTPAESPKTQESATLAQEAPGDLPDEDPDLTFWGTRPGNAVGWLLGIFGSVMTTAVALDWTFVVMGSAAALATTLVACVVLDRRWRAASKTQASAQEHR